MFWIIAAKFYSPDEIGIATALISLVSITLLLSRLGFGQSLIRYYPEMDKSKVFCTSLYVTLGLSLVIGTALAGTVHYWAPDLEIVRGHFLFLLLFLVAYPFTSLAQTSFLAMRKAEYSFVIDFSMSSRLLFLIPYVFLGALGVFSAIGTAFIIGFFTSLVFLAKSGIRLARMDREFLRKSYRYSSGNYLTELFSNAPVYILPIIILNTLGPERTGQYYLAFTIASLLFVIPGAFSTSLFVEGSHGESLKRTTVSALRSAICVLLPAVALIWFLGEWMLGLIGESYAQAAPLLRILALSTFLVSVVTVFYSIKRVQKDLKSLIAVSGLLFVLLIATSLYSVATFGLLGVGYSWLASYTITACVVLILARREKWI